MGVLPILNSISLSVWEKMVKEIHVEGFDALISKLDEVKEEKIYILFSGSPGADGKSWCPQCVDG